LQGAGPANHAAVVTFASNGPVQIFYETFGDPDDPTLVLVNGLLLLL
jgi:hypothetical protein